MFFYINKYIAASFLQVYHAICDKSTAIIMNEKHF